MDARSTGKESPPAWLPRPAKEHDSRRPCPGQDDGKKIASRMTERGAEDVHSNDSLGLRILTLLLGRHAPVESAILNLYARRGPYRRSGRVGFGWLLSWGCFPGFPLRPPPQPGRD